MPCTTAIDVFEQLRPRLVALSLRIVGSAADAEDVVQDCFLKWQAADRDALATPAAWLTTVVQHQSIDRLRRRAREVQAAHAAMELVPAAPPALPDEALLRRADVGDALARMFARLSPSERLALVLFDVFECGHADIAAALGTTPANARQHLSRARRRLRAPDGDTPPDDKLCRELIRRFHAALDGLDVPAMVNLLTETQPMAVRASANDATYYLMLAA
ncbi:sigma-70 family RNA polymerase sigma factor [Telluria mixta]|uniref:Sigma-70 family RNA polymerase sigma factor n=1 Tax=Telluria mixta TaxID=34071 RepID=A0ABT2BUN9_9BURK|nr:sigma-70 family RNA polymerase sigma factor [Telluria mixta]MCS0628144.1 sigma-70 family RNA polymerase sigma factor [Telluria mixta]WEM93740.1 sigma-70 family RNA polymerase sigma factor [Telluria mixta]